MRIVSWNVNGVRANYKKGAWNWLISDSPDIFCLQETKAHPDQMPEEVRNPLGFFAYFDHSKEKKGYSGVAIYTKIKPEKVYEGLGIEEFDKEGRTLIVDFGKYIVVNAYFPNGGGGPVRLDYKLRFYKAFLEKMNFFKKQGKNVIFCGDVNTAHTEIDLARPKENMESTGFLPIERAWIDEVISNGYVDIWRFLNTEKKNVYSYWDTKTSARERNVGWRIDYFFINKEIIPKVKSAEIHTDITGSDHCPISLDINL